MAAAAGGGAAAASSSVRWASAPLAGRMPSVIDVPEGPRMQPNGADPHAGTSTLPPELPQACWHFSSVREEVGRAPRSHQQATSSTLHTPRCTATRRSTAA